MLRCGSGRDRAIANQSLSPGSRSKSRASGFVLYLRSRFSATLARVPTFPVSLDLASEVAHPRANSAIGMWDYLLVLVSRAVVEVVVAERHGDADGTRLTVQRG